MRPLALLVLAALGASMMILLASRAQAADFVVTTTANSGAGSLPQAIVDANANAGADTIRFQAGLSGTITPASTLDVTDSAGLTIDGAAANITISGNDQVQVFEVSSEANLTLANLTVAHGNTGDSGGGISNLGTLTVTNSTFSENSATMLGGGIDNRGTLTVSNSTFSLNSTNNAGLNSFGGGIFNGDSGVATVSNSTFFGNRALGAGGQGGGIAQLGPASLTVNNSTFSENLAAEGGGILCDSGSFEGTHDTFTHNEGGNLVLDQDCSLGLSNSILANAEQGSNCSAPILDGGYNISDDASCAFSASTSKNSTKPRLHPKGLGDHGGPTQTIRLLPNSPAIHAIPTNANGCGTDVTTDQRGILRPQGPGCDIGAFEVEHKKKEKKEKNRR
jgi:hypothetical protein